MKETLDKYALCMLMWESHSDDKYLIGARALGIGDTIRVYLIEIEDK